MSAKKENAARRCEDCGLTMPESAGGRCPRCGACIGRGIDYCSALPAVSLVNPYEVQYREICDDVYEGRLSDSACGDFVVSMERLADDGDDMAQHFLGRYIYLGKDWKYMYELLEKSAEKGNALAENDLGVMYARGDYVQQDEYAAIRLYRESAEKGNPRAMINLAGRYAEGIGLLKDEVRAAGLMRAAAERGESDAQYDMYLRCWTGNGVERDVTTALMWCRTAAERNYPPAERELALCYSGGVGVHKDDAEAFKWMKRAADHGDLASSLDLSILYCHGIGTEKNPGRAYYLASDLADRGYEEAYWQVGYHFRNGIGVRQDIERADKWLFKALDSNAMSPWRANKPETAEKEFASRMRWAGEDAVRVLRVGNWAADSNYPQGALDAFGKAAALGSREAQYNLGVIYERGMFGVERQMDNALKWYRNSAEEGDPRSEWRLALLYRDGVAVEKDGAKAESLMRSAADKGDHWAEYDLAIMLTDGTCAEQDNPKAMKLMEKSAESGYVPALADFGARLVDGRDVSQDVPRGIEMLDAAARGGNARCWTVLGRYSFFGQVVPRDYGRAIEYYRLGAEAGDADAYAALSVMYENGLGCAPDSLMAQEMKSSACRLSGRADKVADSPEYAAQRKEDVKRLEEMAIKDKPKDAGPEPLDDGYKMFLFMATTAGVLIVIWLISNIFK